MSYRMSGAEHGLSGKAPTMTDRQETQLNVAPTPPGFTISRTGMRGTVSPGLGDAIEGSVSVQHSAPLSLVSSWPRGSYCPPPPSSFHSPGLETLSLRVSPFRNEDPFLRSSYPRPTSCHVSQAKIIHVPLPGHFWARCCRPPCFLAQSWFSLRSWAYLSRSRWKVSVSTKSGFSWQGNERGGERAARQATQTHRTGRKTGFHSWMWKQKLGPTNP